ncbi:hypothetical protein E3T34_11600 [Cryobacterium sp. TMT1-62]|uniref:hypothetical protein n=1 Tax=unclassified Cryobacterium TaxID=2649013 RepID=UPI00106C3BE1|nr:MULTISPECIES: hypothetical protein [unclassified Cryobacterium]TFB54831.1 hypothetical protein E3N94_10400 [Cryobacterium sp. Sr3]TFD31101.1 hypothetical protein E3T34_11600 [Cryobacterium sp. TMT1-62]
MSKRISREQPDDVDNSAAFAFRTVEDVLVVSHSVSEISQRGQCVIERVSVGTWWEGFVEMRNPDGFLVSVHEEVGPEAKHEFGDDLAGYWRRVW